MAKNLAIAVGINHYEHHPERRLRYAVRDADLLGDFLCESAGFESANVIRCLGEETQRGAVNYPSCSNLIRLLNRELKPSNTGPVQHLWFFFSGHGVSQNGRDFLVPSDCLEEDYRFLLPVDEVIAALRLHQNAEIVLVLDACREKIGSKGHGSAMGAQTAEFAKERGVTTIFSCGYGQLSYELEALQQGAFTQALIEGLGQFTLPFQLEPFLVRRVNGLHREARKSVTQTPKIQTDSTAKVFQSLLPDCVTDGDVACLLEQAKEAELEEAFEDAKRWFRQVAEVAPLSAQRREAWKALDRIERKMARQSAQPTTAVQSEVSISPPIPEPTAPGPVPVTSTSQIEIDTVPISSDEDENGPDSQDLRKTEQWQVVDQETLVLVQKERAADLLFMHVDDVPLKSDRDVDYCNLRDLLKAGKWHEADKETLNVMLKTTDRQSQGWLDEESIQKFPFLDLRTIDHLWVTASEGFFGFSVQKEIYVQCKGKLDDKYPGSAVWEKFGDTVGWRANQTWQKYDALVKQKSISSLKGVLPLWPVFCLGWGGRWVVFPLFSRIEACELYFTRQFIARSKDGVALSTASVGAISKDGAALLSIAAAASGAAASKTVAESISKVIGWLGMSAVHHTAITPNTAIITPVPKNPIDTICLSSEKGVDYGKLRDLLKAEKWREADQETRSVMLQATNRVSDGWLDEASLKNFPCKDLQTIDRLWVTASQGHFGFSVQKEIYVRCGGKLDGTYPGDKVWQKFGDTVGWRMAQKWQGYDSLVAKIPFSSPRGNFPLGGGEDFYLCGRWGFGWNLFSRIRTCMAFAGFRTKELSLPSHADDLF